MPLTFLVGIYGMNFDPKAGPLSMPELESPWGYPIFLLACLVIAVGMALFFRHKKWL